MNATQDEKRFTIVDQVEVEDEWVDLVDQARSMGLFPTADKGPSSNGLLMRVRNDCMVIHPVYSKEPSMGLAEVEAEITQALQTRRGKRRKRLLPDPDPGKVLANACQTALSLWRILRVDSLALRHRYDHFTPRSMDSLVLTLSLRFTDSAGNVRCIEGHQAIQRGLLGREYLEQVESQIDYWLRDAVLDIIERTRKNGGIIRP